MANRAYLYSSNGDSLEAQSVHEEPYYDSRHVVPIAWPLFFDRASVHSRQDADCAAWLRVLLVRPKEAALREFAARLPYLADLQLEAAVDYGLFLERIRRFPNKWLILDPEQIVGGEGLDGGAAAQLFRNALTSLESRDMSAFMEALRPFAGDVAQADDRNLDMSVENYVVGVTYWA